MSGQSVKEISEFMGISPNNVKVRLHRARKQLGERLEKMIGKHLSKEKLKAGFVFKVVDAIRDMPIPSLPKPRPIRWAPNPISIGITISIGIALLIGIIGYGTSSVKDVSSEMPIFKPAEATFEVSLFSDTNGQTVLDTVSDMEVLDMGSENIYQSDLASADAGTAAQTQPTAGTESSGVVVRRAWDKAQDFQGTVSPNGRYLSYINWGMGGNLAIYDFETGKSRDLTDEANWGKEPEFSDDSIWSPDSKQIAYLWWKGSDTSLCIVGIDGSKPRVLCSSTTGSGPLPRAWSRDGKHILAIHWRKEDETHDIVLISVADGSMRVLKSLDGYQFRNRMSLSPDDRYVVYDCPQGDDSSNRNILLLATDGSQETALVEHPADNFGPVWAPDGNRIVFVSDRSGSIGVWVLEMADGKPKGSPQLINHNFGKMFPLGVTQDGSYYYGLPGRLYDIYFADLDPETGEVVKPPTKAVQVFEGLNAGPDFSPDGKYLAYLRHPTGGGTFAKLVIRALETGEEREVSPKIRGFGSYALWAPDGRSVLAIAGKSKEDHGIHQIDIETGAATPVVLQGEHEAISVNPPVWSPDGNRIFFTRKSGGIWGIRAYDFAAKREWKPDFQLACGEGCGGLALSPDGQQLAFMVSCDNERSLQIAPSSGGDAREIAKVQAHGRGLVWTPDGRYLLFLGKPKDEAAWLCELWRIPVEGGGPQNLGLTIWAYPPLSFHPDGRRIAFTGPGPRPGDEVWVMENILPTSTASK